MKLTAEQARAMRDPALCLSGADTLRDSLHTLPPGLDVYGSYVDNFGGFPELQQMRGHLGPSATYFGYTIFGNSAHCADVEPGAMSAASFGRWLRDGRGISMPGARVPGGYTSAGNADSLFAAAGQFGLPHDELPENFIYQSAHYNGRPHICAPSTCGFRQAHSTQWDDKGIHGENYDRALWLPGVLDNPAHPVPKPPEETMSIAVAMNEGGRLEAFAQLQDGSVKHTWQVEPGGHWQGEDPKDPTKQAAWRPLGNPGK